MIKCKRRSWFEELVFGWWLGSKGCRLEDDGTDFDEDNEVTILIPSFIDFFKKKNKSYMCVVWMCDHYCIIWFSMLGDDEGSRATAKGKSVLVFWYLVGF